MKEPVSLDTGPMRMKRCGDIMQDFPHNLIFIRHFTTISMEAVPQDGTSKHRRCIMVGHGIVIVRCVPEMSEDPSSQEESLLDTRARILITGLRAIGVVVKPTTSTKVSYFHL
jgi:hypothetical protein